MIILFKMKIHCRISKIHSCFQKKTIKCHWSYFDISQNNFSRSAGWMKTFCRGQSPAAEREYGTKTVWSSWSNLPSLSLFTGLWIGSNHYLMCCKRVNVIVPMSICVTTLVERNVSSTRIEEAESPCERLSKPKCSMNLTFSELEFSCFSYVEEYVF